MTTTVALDLDKLNSLTKYPSIPTYHKLDPKTGGLIGDPIGFPDGWFASEKIDGSNVRLCFTPGGSVLVGSREEWLTREGDVVHNATGGIVTAMRPVLEAMTRPDGGGLCVFYGELYGIKSTPAWREYGGDGTIGGFRVFDVMHMSPDDYWEAMTWERPHLASWRQQGEQPFASEAELAALVEYADLELTPRLFWGEPGTNLPASVDGMHELLKQWMPATHARLDGGEGGRAEGLVFRSADRTVIAKARFEDYERAERRAAALAARFR